MPISEKQRGYRDKWDAENMAYQTIKVRRELLDNFRAACAARGDKVNTVLKNAMQAYVDSAGGSSSGPADSPDAPQDSSGNSG